MKNLFKFLASMVYPFLIALFAMIYCDFNKIGDYQAVTIILTIIFGIIAVVGIVGNIVVLSIEAHKENINAKNTSEADK